MFQTGLIRDFQVALQVQALTVLLVSRNSSGETLPDSIKRLNIYPDRDT